MMHNLPMTQMQGALLSLGIIVSIVSINITNALVLYRKVYKMNNELKSQLCQAREELISLKRELKEHNRV